MIPENNKLKIAFLGGGLNSAVGSAHYSAISLSGRYKIISGCFSRDRKINHETARHYGVEESHVYDDLINLIENEKEKIDAIVILTPTNQHMQQVINCLQNHIPVICEKPLASNCLEINKIRKTLEFNSGFLTIIYNYLGYPILRELRYIIKHGKIGKIHHIQIEMPQEGFKRIDINANPISVQKWRLHDEKIPTISLDLGVHLHMIIKFLTGEIPLDVVSSSESFGNFPGIIDNISCIIKYTNNMRCNMWYSKIALGERNGLKIRVYGENGSAEWIQEHPEFLELSDNQGHRCIVDRGSNEVKICNQSRYKRFKAGHPAGFIEAFANYYEDIANSLNLYFKNKDSSNENCFGIEEAFEGIQLLEAISKSSSTRKWEKVIL